MRGERQARISVAATENIAQQNIDSKGPLVMLREGLALSKSVEIRAFWANFQPLGHTGKLCIFCYTVFTVRKFLNQYTTLKRIEVKFYEAHLPQHDTEDTI